MKNNLEYYPMWAHGHNSWQHKVLRKHYGWEGAGKFWALCDMIAVCDNCVLTLDNKHKLYTIAVDLDFEPKELMAFIGFLLEEVELLIKKDDGYTTDFIQEALAVVSKVRAYDRKRKAAKTPGVIKPENADTGAEQEHSIRKPAFSIPENEQSKVKEIKEKEIKEKETKEKYMYIAPQSCAKHTHTHTGVVNNAANSLKQPLHILAKPILPKQPLPFNKNNPHGPGANKIRAG